MLITIAYTSSESTLQYQEKIIIDSKHQSRRADDDKFTKHCRPTILALKQPLSRPPCRQCRRH